MPERITIGQRVHELAAGHPDRPAIVFVDRFGTETTTTWRELAEEVRAAAAVLAREGVDHDSVVGVKLPNSLEHVVVTHAAWQLHATVLPLNPQLPDAYLEPLGRAHDVMVVGDGAGCSLPGRFWDEAGSNGAHGRSSARPAAGQPRLARLTGGSTGTPRIVVTPNPEWTYPPDGILDSLYAPLGVNLRQFGVRPGQVQLVTLPLYHAGFTCLHYGLALDHTVVLLEQFVPQVALSAIEDFGAHFFRIVPLQMRWLLDLPGFSTRALRSVEAIHHGAGPCPERVKQAWMQTIGPEKVVEIYTSVEAFFLLAIRGDEWLAHPGSVGRPGPGDVRIVGPSGRDVAAGEIGEVYLRSSESRQPEYLGPGSPLPQVDDLMSAGDVGFLDADGYLHIVGRVDDAVNVGGVTVFPSAIEDALLAFPGVKDVAVRARPHDYLGHVPHAYIVPEDVERPPTQSELAAHCRRRLTPAEVPLSYDFTAALPRDAAGKLRRSILR